LHAVGACASAVTDPDTGELISDAQVSEVEYTAFADTYHTGNCVPITHTSS